MAVEIALESEPYSRFGSISADGVRRLLGAPPMDRLTTMIRETVQNSWDARIKDGDRSPEYRIRVRELSKQQAEFLSDSFFAEFPEDGEEKAFRARLQENPWVVEVSDFGTVGLGGPTRPTEAVAEDESSNFVDFIRNVGTPRNEKLGGGTYGFGKSSLFALSEASTVILDSETIFRGRQVRRVMACRTGIQYSVPKKGRFTGRHWWGHRSPDDSLEPFSGRDAASIRTKLGLPDREQGGTGTTIVVLAPDIPRDVVLLEERIVRTLMVNFWPKLVARKRGGRAEMDFRVEVNGRDVHVPDPAECPPFNLFARALKAVRSGSDGAEQMRCHNPKRDLGFLAIESARIRDRRTILSAVPEESEGTVETDPLGTPCHHVALMRPAELVVKYLPGPTAGPGDEWAGVFITSSEADIEAAFAESEPPAHDDWNPDYIRSTQGRKLVRVALRRIKEQLDKRFRPAPAEIMPGGHEHPMGAIADRFGQALLSSGAGPGVTTAVIKPAGGAKGASSGTGRGRNALSPLRPIFERLAFHGEEPVAIFSLDVSNSGDVVSQLLAKPMLVMDGRATDASSLPPGVKPPKLIGWKHGDTFHKGSKLGVPSGEMKLEILVTCDGEHTSTLEVEEVGHAR